VSPRVKIIYSPKYQVNIGDHVFPTNKYLLIYNRLLNEGLLTERDIIFPRSAPRDDILLVHTEDYTRKLFEGKLSIFDIMKLELPYSEALVEASRICVEGTIESCRYAVKEGVSVHIGGGFHHAFSDHGEGFCVFNDIAIGIRRLQRDGLISKALVVDCDLHQGNGTAAIFADDKSVFTFSMHQENNYPGIKPPSRLDIGLLDGTGDDEYLQALDNNIPRIIENFAPDFVLYVAGADPYEKDQLGGLALTIEGLERRDRAIFELCKKHKVPVSAVLAGGYAIDIEDTVTIHYNMIKAAFIR